MALSNSPDCTSARPSERLRLQLRWVGRDGLGQQSDGALDLLRLQQCLAECHLQIGSIGRHAVQLLEQGQGCLEVAGRVECAGEFAFEPGIAWRELEGFAQLRRGLERLVLVAGDACAHDVTLHRRRQFLQRVE